MKINAQISYNESYLPTKRHRIPRLRAVEETVEIELREVKKEDAKLAMTVTDYQSYLDPDGKDHFGPKDKDIFAIGPDLYTQKKDMSGALDKGEYSLSRFVGDVQIYGKTRVWCSNEADRTRNFVLRQLKDLVDDHLVIDGKVYKRSGEPRYVVNTFGLGHNHGSTNMFIEYGYNPNISKDCYFNALQREEAIAFGKHVAEERGDTESIDRIGKNIDIKVFMPEMVHCDPTLEHGDGNPLLNSLESMIRASGNQAEAGLLVIAEAAAQIASDKKPSLEARIQSASDHAAACETATEGKTRGAQIDR